jgi:hypothetical protein
MVAGEIAHQLVKQLGLVKTIIVVVFLVWGTGFILLSLIRFFYQCVLLIGGCDM